MGDISTVARDDTCEQLGDTSITFAMLTPLGMTSEKISNVSVGITLAS